MSGNSCQDAEARRKPRTEKCDDPESAASIVLTARLFPSACGIRIATQRREFVGLK
jgi:hypothetical protein